MRIIIVSMLLTGCAGFGGFGQPDYASMTAAHTKSVVSDKNASVICNRFPTPYGFFESTVVTFDQKSIQDGSVKGSSQNGGCLAEITSAAPPKAAKDPTPGAPPK